MKKMFEYLLSRKLTPNQLFVLDSIDQQVDYGSFIPNMKIELVRLQDKGLLDVSFNITILGKQILQECRELDTPKKKKAVQHGDWTEQIETYRQRVPAGHGSGKAFRSPVRELLPRFEWFFQNYPFSWDVVLQATRKYVESKKDDLTYMRTSAYFIKKQDSSKVEISDLAHWCELVQQELDNPDSVKPDMDYAGLYKVV
jgi:hypothetical protein